MTNSELQAPIHVAVACDEGYFMPLAVLIASICATACKAPIVIHVIHPSLDATERERIECSLTSGVVTIDWIAIAPERLDQFSATISSFDHVSVAAYYRLLLPELLPATLEKVLYLDCDLVVMEDLAGLWACSLEGALFAAVPEQAPRASTAAAPQGIRQPASVGMSPDQKLFNSGVMLIDLARWRAELIAHRCFSYIKAAQAISRWHDQEALNVVAQADWIALAPRWNITMHALGMDAAPESSGCAIEHPAIIHYNTSRKPWMAGFRGGYLRQFHGYLDQTDWKGTRPVPSSIRDRMLARIGRILSKARREYTWLSAQVAASIRRSLSRIKRGLISSRQHETDIHLFICGNEADAKRDLAEQAKASGIRKVFHVDGKGAANRHRLRDMLEVHGRGHWCIVLPADADVTGVDWFQLRQTLQEKGCNARLIKTASGARKLLRSQGYAWDAFSHRVVAGPVLFDPASAPEQAAAASRVGFFYAPMDAAIGEDCTIVADARLDEGLIEISGPSAQHGQTVSGIAI